MLITLIAAALLALFAGQALPRVYSMSPAVWAHVVLAVGIMPLISAAILHFAPVLTRSRAAGFILSRLPWLMLVAGLMTVSVLSGYFAFSWIGLSAVLGLSGSIGLLFWIGSLGQSALGPAHPGLYWYAAALISLSLGLCAALLLPFMPNWHSELRSFHLTINLYGFVALTAVGTLQVLMPTVVHQADPGVRQRLQGDLKWAFGSALLLASGVAGSQPVIVWIGVAGWSWVISHMAWTWGRLYRSKILSWHGAAPVLAVATLGLLQALFNVLANPGSSQLKLFLPAFLMPLVTGAAGQLAPVWLSPGRRAEHIAKGQQKLNRWAGVRALLFLTAGVLPMLGFKCSGMPALTALFWFGMVFILWLWRDEA